VYCWDLVCPETATVAEKESATLKTVLRDKFIHVRRSCDRLVSCPHKVVSHKLQRKQPDRINEVYKEIRKMVKKVIRHK
jgi:hypothetical protein